MLFALLLLGWLSVVSGGMAVVWSYHHRPGEPAEAPSHWPAGSQIRRGDGYTLVLLAHPKCPCTRATLEELSKLLAHTQGRLTTFVLFVKPRGTPDNWNQTDLWHRAAELPDVSVLNDVDGVEAKRFGAYVSGQALLYDAKGNLVFHGGITESRGQIGDNAGRSAVEALVNQGTSDRDRTMVFGCPLFDANECRTPEHAIRTK